MKKFKKWSLAELEAEATLMSGLGYDELSDSIGSINPNIGDEKIVPKVALIPIFVNSCISLNKCLNLSLIQVHNPAIIPVNPASGPTLAPKIKGNRAEKKEEKILLYLYLPFILISFITVFNSSGESPNFFFHIPVKYLL